LIIPSSGTGKSGKSNKAQSAVILGVAERGLAGAIQGDMGISCDTGERSLELIRGARLHQEKILEKHGMQKGDVKVAQLGLGHSYSRSKVKVSVDEWFHLKNWVVLKWHILISVLGLFFHTSHGELDHKLNLLVQRQPIRQHDHPSHLTL
jgi:hypothetical protein